MELLIATRNRGKLAELADAFGELPLILRSLDEFPQVLEVEETGCSFRENAELKARAYSGQTGIASLADDSGLVVPAIDGRPGVFSARFAGKTANDEENIRKLLHELRNAKGRQRAARFVCEMAVSDRSGKILFNSAGHCEGLITHKPFGTNGFGYDPVFVPDGYDETFGELPEEAKRKVSHRSIALKKIIDFFNSILVS